MAKLQKLTDGDGFDGIRYPAKIGEFDQNDILLQLWDRMIVTPQCHEPIRRGMTIPLGKQGDLQARGARANARVNRRVPRGRGSVI